MGTSEYTGRRLDTAVELGDLRRLQPISGYFGYDRGTPVDRVYIGDFLRRHARDIRGRVLEVKDRSYTRACGGDAVTRSDVLDIDAGNPEVTIVADLERPEQLPADAFDCFILTQTLHLVFEARTALVAAARTLRPGGVLLVTVPTITPLDTWAVRHGGDYWRFTSLALRRLLTDVFPTGAVEVEGAGNVLTATAFLQGLAAEELDPDELRFHDPAYELLALGRAVKSPRP